MAHKTEEEIITLLDGSPETHSAWVHKRSGRVYHVVGRVIIEATVEVGVIYQDDSQIRWMRPLNDFLEKFEEYRDT